MSPTSLAEVIHRHTGARPRLWAEMTWPQVTAMRDGGLRAIESLIDQGTLAMRTDPDASKRVADRALEL